MSEQKSGLSGCLGGAAVTFLGIIAFVLLVGLVGCIFLAKGCADVGTHMAKDQQQRSQALSALEFTGVKVTTDENWMYVKGSIRNGGSQPVKFVKVVVEWKDSAGNVVDTDWTYGVGATELAPGGSKTFEVMTKRVRSVKSASYRFEE